MNQLVGAAAVATVVNAALMAASAPARHCPKSINKKLSVGSQTPERVETGTAMSERRRTPSREDRDPDTEPSVELLRAPPAPPPAPPPKPPPAPPNPPSASKGHKHAAAAPAPRPPSGRADATAEHERHQRFLEHIESMRTAVHEQADGWLERAIRDALQKQAVMCMMASEEALEQHPEKRSVDAAQRRRRLQETLSDAYTRVAQAEASAQAAHAELKHAIDIKAFTDEEMRHLDVYIAQARTRIEELDKDAAATSAHDKELHMGLDALHTKLDSLPSEETLVEAAEVSPNMQKRNVYSSEISEKTQLLGSNERHRRKISEEINDASTDLRQLDARKAAVAEQQRDIQNAVYRAQATYEDAVSVLDDAREHMKDKQMVLEPATALLLLGTHSSSAAASSSSATPSSAPSAAPATKTAGATSGGKTGGSAKPRAAAAPAGGFLQELNARVAGRYVD